MREASRLVEREDVEALVVSFFNAYRTPAHEAEAKKVLAERFRRSTSVLPRGLAADPRVRADDRGDPQRLRPPRVDRLPRAPGAGAGRQAGVRVPLYITKSNGGVTTARDARQATAETLLSGPASGVIGATSVCGRAGYRDLITFDMGGTSADIALVRDGRPVYSTDETVGRLPDRDAGRGSRRSAPAAARSPGSTRWACSRSGRGARAPTPARPATAAAASSRPCPTPSSSAAS